VSCLAQCDRAPATLDVDLEVVSYEDRERGVTPDDPELPINLAGAQDLEWKALALARRMEREAVFDAIEASGLQGRGAHLEPFDVRIVNGHGAYICGEETALLESLEGRRGMPRLKPPYPTEHGFRGKPTLMHNVETAACVPSILSRGGPWFRDRGRTEAGSKLYCVSGHVVRPGVYELPLGATLDELAVAAGGYLGTPAAFSPGGASSGFLPVSMRELPMDFASLAKVGSMLGSAGVVVLDDTVDLARAAQWQTQFFEDESCGQCAPCRIGSRWLHRAVTRYLETGDPAALEHAAEVGWEMEEGSICGLGMVAAKPFESARQYFPQAFEPRRTGSEES
jgi:NADH:ubiquinone oxidoreductase subunit F (NADH-binding)